MIDGLQIPIVKLTVDFMQTAILHAIEPELLSQQLKKATDEALARIDFTAMIRNEITNLTVQMLKDSNLMLPIKEKIYGILEKSIEEMTNPEQEQAHG